MVPLSQFPFVVVRLSCPHCKREGSYRLARLAAKYGAEIDLDALLERLTADCALRVEPRRRRWDSPDCHAYYVDLRRSLPPDLPPGMFKLRLVKG